MRLGPRTGPREEPDWDFVRLVIMSPVVVAPLLRLLLYDDHLLGLARRVEPQACAAPGKARHDARPEGWEAAAHPVCDVVCVIEIDLSIKSVDRKATGRK